MSFRTYSVLVAMFLCTCAYAQSGPQMKAKDIIDLNLPDVQITGIFEPDAKKPSDVRHVFVDGVIGGSIRFRLHMPENWNGRFAMGGGGGFVGSVQNQASYSVNQGYATVGTDTGHDWPSDYMAGWAVDDLEAQVNFGHVAVHRTAEVSKAIIRAYYGKGPSYSYFLGCSRGGGQAMMESQRYPDDFDGIVAGAPAFDFGGFAAAAVDQAQAMYPDPGRMDTSAVSSKTLEKLYKAIIEACDGIDGLEDGIIDDPRECDIDLAALEWLTETERNALEAVYDGASNGDGKIYPGLPVGAESGPGGWFTWVTGPVKGMLKADAVPSLSFAFGTQLFKHLIFHDADWDYSRYDFSTWEQDTHLAASFLSATDPDLGAFNAKGGKLILWHGWADPALSALATIDYYEKVQAHDAKAMDYCRLFLMPGVLHCSGGPGPSTVDWLGAISDWVENGVAPDRVIASKSRGSRGTMTRPLYPYPQRARYTGSGDVNDAKNFTSREP